MPKYSSAQKASVEALESRRLMSATWSPQAQYIYQPAAILSFPKLTGKGETVAVLDTGIAAVPSLKGKIVGGYNFIDGNTKYNDTDGHGTSVASLIASSAFTYNGQRYQGIAPGVKLAAVKIDNGDGNPTAANIQAGLQWVLNNARKYNIVAVNLSEGDNGRYFDHNASGLYDSELSQLAARGIFVAAASGNDSWHDSMEYPAANPNVAAIGSSNFSSGNISAFSDTGPALDLTAPGENVVFATLVNGRAGYSTESGTSFSTPMAVGAAALIRQANKTLSVQDILAVEQSTPLYDADTISGQFYPRLDLFNSLYIATHPVSAQFSRKAILA